MMQQKNGNGHAGQHIYSVSQLTDKIKELLENHFPFVWVAGEITNFSVPMSGHFYFSLKDENAQISAVMFRGQNRNLKFEPTDGMAVTGLGRISLYKPRGSYQIIFEYMEPKGVGALQVAFEQLKAKLEAEGLFKPERKKPLPFLARKIALITSPTGAVLHDILKIAKRRHENIHFMIVPVKVQGNGAIQDIVRAIELVNSHGVADIAILARGGGSLEDLQAFNSEQVARAVADSNIPIVSAIGHETDYTIADFVADYRAPTPSAAAEILVPEKENLLRHIDSLSKTIRSVMKARLKQAESEIRNVSGRLKDPVKHVQDLRMRCDDIAAQLIRHINMAMRRHREQLNWRIETLGRVSPMNQSIKYKERIQFLKDRLNADIRSCFQQHAGAFEKLAASLRILSPLAVLDRGYSIVRKIPEKKVVTNQEQVNERENLEVLLARGALGVTVNEKWRSGDSLQDFE